MKLLSIGFALVISIFSGFLQDERNPELETLVSISEKADFADFHQLTVKLGYSVLDSSVDEKKSVFFFTRDFKYHGNTLACSVNSKSKITELTFMTFNFQLYKEYKSKLTKLGFKSEGKHSDGLPGITESEDFAKGKILITSAIRKNGSEEPLYEFTFIIW